MPVTQFKLRRGTAAQWAAANPVLAQGEPGYATDVKTFKIGNGVQTWNELTSVADEAVDRVVDSLEESAQIASASATAAAVASSASAAASASSAASSAALAEQITGINDIAGAMATTDADPVSPFRVQQDARLNEGGTFERLSALGKSFLIPQALGGMIDGLKCDILTSGDSQTGYLGGGVVGRFPRWSEVCAFYLGVTVRNNGVGGEQPQDTIFRAGGRTLTFTIPGGEIPAGTEEFVVTQVSVAANLGFAGQGPLPSNISNFPVCLVDGEPMAIRYVDGGTWYMRRLIAGGVMKAPTNGVKARVLGGQTHRSNTLHIWATGNNDSDPTRNNTVEDMLLNWIDPTTSDYLTLSLYPTPSQAADHASTGWTQKMEVNANRLSRHGVRYFDSYSYLLNDALDDAIDYGLLTAAVAGDATDQGIGLIPRSLRVGNDDQHLNWIAHRLLGIKIARHVIGNGLLDKSKGTDFPLALSELPVFPSDLAGPKQITILTGGSATRATPDPIKALQSFSIRFLVRPHDLSATSAYLSRNDADGARVWAYRIVAGGDTLRWTWYPTGNSAGSIQNTSTSAALAVDEWVWLRLDFDAAERRTRYYKADDNGTSEPASWTQVGTDIVSTPTTMPNNSALLSLTSYADYRRVQVKSFDGVTTHLDNNFETEGAADWTFTGDASLAPL